MFARLWSWSPAASTNKDEVGRGSGLEIFFIYRPICLARQLPNNTRAIRAAATQSSTSLYSFCRFKAFVKHRWNPTRFVILPKNDGRLAS